MLVSWIRFNTSRKHFAVFLVTTLVQTAVICICFGCFRVRTGIQVLFSRTCKDQIQGFPELKNPFFQDFPGNVPFKTLVARGQKVHIQNQLSVYLH